MIFGLASCVWISSFTRSMGAVAVLATDPEIPPAAKSLANATGSNSFLAYAVGGAMQGAAVCAASRPCRPCVR